MLSKTLVIQNLIYSYSIYIFGHFIYKDWKSNLLDTAVSTKKFYIPITILKLYIYICVYIYIYMYIYMHVDNNLIIIYMHILQYIH